MIRFEIGKQMANLTLVKFKKWHTDWNKENGGIDKLSAEERYAKLGGKLPKAKKSEGAE